MEKSKKNYFQFAFFAFLFITVITSLSVILANMGLLGDTVRMSKFAEWGMVAILGEIVGATILFFKSGFQKETQTEPSGIWINFDFPKDIPDIEFSQNEPNGEFKILDKDDNIILLPDNKLMIQQSPSGYYSWKVPAKIASHIKPDCTINMTLEEVNKKRKWTIRESPTSPNLREIISVTPQEVKK